MTSPPPAIFFINGDINYPPPATFIGAGPSIDEFTTIITQLYIDGYMTKAEFDARVAVDPNYPTIIHLQNLRILVILPTFQDLVNRQLADVVIFLHQGLADIEKNNFGPPGQNYPVQRMNLWAMLRAACSPNVIILPFQANATCGSCHYPFYCDSCHTFSGIRICHGCGCNAKCGCDCRLTDNQGIVQNPIFAPNCDNIYHNEDFINRK